jgi:hypothetical protein
MRDREGLIARIRQMRRTAAAAAEPRQAESRNPEPERLDALEARLEHLEHLVQGLQDSVHREFSRHDERITEVEARIRPAALGKALSEDARARGL